VQAILDGRRPSLVPEKKVNPLLPLKCFVRCESCGTPLTGKLASGRIKNPRYCARDDELRKWLVGGPKHSEFEPVRREPVQSRGPECRSCQYSYGFARYWSITRWCRFATSKGGHSLRKCRNDAGLIPLSVLELRRGRIWYVRKQASAYKSVRFRISSSIASETLSCNARIASSVAGPSGHNLLQM
jgi:hypothetical protein